MSDAITVFDKMINVLSNSSLAGIMAFTGKAVGVAAESVVSEYPEASGKPLAAVYTRTNAKGETYQSKFKTLRQQRKVMALASEGKIPYRRTGGLGRSITSDIANLTPVSVDVLIGSSWKDAFLVIGTPAEGQSMYHQGTWQPLQTDIDNNAAKLNTVAQKAFGQAIRAALL